MSFKAASFLLVYNLAHHHNNNRVWYPEPYHQASSNKEHQVAFLSVGSGNKPLAASNNNTHHRQHQAYSSIHLNNKQTARQRVSHRIYRNGRQRLTWEEEHRVRLQQVKLRWI